MSASVLVVGDSIAMGYPDFDTFTGRNVTNTLQQGGGWIARSLAGKGGLINIAMSSDTAGAFSGVQYGVQDGSFRRLSHARYCTHALVATGRNDLSGGKSLTQLQSYLVQIWRTLAWRGLKVWGSTVLPRTSSTDSWFTTGGQTPHSSESIRVALNDWIRGGAPVDSTYTAVAVGTAGALVTGQPKHPLTGYLEAADTVETARNSGLWKVGRVVADAAMTAGSNVLNSASMNLQASEVGTAVIVRGAGTSGADTSFLQVQSRTSATQAVMTDTAKTTVSGAGAGIGLYTWDGIHPNAWGAAKIAAALDFGPLLAS